MLLVNTFVATSQIDGAGLFAAEDIQAGSVVWEFNPIIDVEITEAQLAALPPAARERALRHSFVSEDGRIILSRDNAVFFNHSDNPNTRAGSDGNVALRDISAGEELTEDYRVFPRGACSEFLYETESQ